MKINWRLVSWISDSPVDCHTSARNRSAKIGRQDFVSLNKFSRQKISCLITWIWKIIMQGQRIWPVYVLLMKNSTNLDSSEMTVSPSMEMKGRIGLSKQRKNTVWYKKNEREEILKCFNTNTKSIGTIFQKNQRWMSYYDWLTLTNGKKMKIRKPRYVFSFKIECFSMLAAIRPPNISSRWDFVIGDTKQTLKITVRSVTVKRMVLVR